MTLLLSQATINKSDFQGVVPGPGASTAPEILLEMQMPGLA